MSLFPVDWLLFELHSAASWARANILEQIGYLSNWPPGLAESATGALNCYWLCSVLLSEHYARPEACSVLKTAPDLAAPPVWCNNRAGHISDADPVQESSPALGQLFTLKWDQSENLLRSLRVANERSRQASRASPASQWLARLPSFFQSCSSMQHNLSARKASERASKPETFSSGLSVQKAHAFHLMSPLEPSIQKQSVRRARGIQITSFCSP